MIIACLDLEGVLTPEIWINVALKTGIDELKLTTRDISDYDELMQHRLAILRKHSIRYSDIYQVIQSLSPLEGAVDFLNLLKTHFQVIILSDTFYQFSNPLMQQLGDPTLFCHDLCIDEDDYITGYTIRIKDSKRQAVLAFQKNNFATIAAGDSYNDVSMLKTADKGILFKPPQKVIDDYPELPVTVTYDELWQEFCAAEKILTES